MRSMVVGLLLGAIGSSGGNISSGNSGSGVGRGGRCDYERGNGLYWSTYGGPVQRSVVTPSSIKLIDDVLAFDYVAGIAHYQNWSTLEPNVVRSCACLLLLLLWLRPLPYSPALAHHRACRASTTGRCWTPHSPLRRARTSP